ncbi:hypothetical protein [Pseudemcibacter aquimaris]|uniref:hypothetical protein n=1 Tax=Pseudemcibacter aquimaris TaxID=2857064 RepID=UPI002012B895|nr:hypothetical protein [Pseudemcibacter aquimaris]MCC3860089.1 hypothetical protein [Pseudemcibacter aquimaris]WDU57418.1 hypothetical protein KW060_09425 [Pseudemcibacter aquimaris]
MIKKSYIFLIFIIFNFSVFAEENEKPIFVKLYEETNEVFENPEGIEGLHEMHVRVHEASSNIRKKYDKRNLETLLKYAQLT